MPKNPVYMIVMLDISDMETFQSDYVRALQPHNAKYGVEAIVATPNPDVLEGIYNKSMTVVLKFPSAKAQRDWYADPDYQPLLKKRFAVTNTATSVALVAPQFQPRA